MEDRIDTFHADKTITLVKVYGKFYAALFRFAFSTKSPKYSANLSSPVDFLLATKVH